MSDRPEVGTHVGNYGQREPRDYDVQIEWLEARLDEAEERLAEWKDLANAHFHRIGEAEADAAAWKANTKDACDKWAAAEALLREARDIFVLRDGGIAGRIDAFLKEKP